MKHARSFHLGRFLIPALLILGMVLTPAPVQADVVEPTGDPPTLRVYGRNSEGAGDATSPAEDKPYTGVEGVNSIFDPQGPQAPVKDSVTFNPLWMYEDETFDENHAYGLYQQLYADGINLAEKVWFRLWYEPAHKDKDNIIYPAIMQEFTYILTEPAPAADVPQPMSGTAGRTQFVFPVGIQKNLLHDPFGYGLTSLDADFDGAPDIVQIDSEQSLFRKTGVEADFNGNGTLDPLNEDGEILSGDELVVLSVDSRAVGIGQGVQFLDHVIEVRNVTNMGVTVDIWYTGDLSPVSVGAQTLGVSEVWSYKTRLPGIPAPAPATIDLGPFFIQVVGVDVRTNTAHLRVGRALGETGATIETKRPTPIDDEPQASLKRFYVDGHEYNVVAIGAEGKENFSFITIRTPVPKKPVTIKQHSVHLQWYDFNSWLPVMPPFNYEHYIISDVMKGQTGRVMGDAFGPVGPILQNPNWLPYRAWRPGRYGPKYNDWKGSRLIYVREQPNPQYTGQLLQVYKENSQGNEYWDVHRWQTEPYLFTEFLLPDIPNYSDLYLYTSAFTSPQSGGHRVKLWFDPYTSSAKYKSPAWLRMYGFDSTGAGDTSVQDPAGKGYPVETPPYTDPEAPFNPLADQAPGKDSITFNPAFMSEFQSCRNDPLVSQLYPRISISAHDALQKVFFRMWYEPDHLNKIRSAGNEYRFPALLQEFTYMYLDTKDQPTYAQPGFSSFAFPSATDWSWLWNSFGAGLTTFDADFDGWHDNVVTVHSEKTLMESTNITADFDGDGQMDDLDQDAEMNGNEMVVFSVDNITLSLNGQNYSSYAMFLDHMIQFQGVTKSGMAKLQVWNTGGGLERTAQGYNIVPHQVGASLPYAPGSMGVVGRNKVNVRQIPAGGSNAGSVDGGWFVYVNDVNTYANTVSVTIGRALGATASAIDNNAKRHDLEPGDPWYLKRFFVDGHEYNVAAIRTHKSGDQYGFKYITIRTPVPKVHFVNRQDSQVLQGYLPNTNSVLSVMPPFNINGHTVAIDILDNHNDVGALGAPACRPPLDILLLDEAIEAEFFGELKEVLRYENGVLEWSNMPFHTLPDAFTEVALPKGELYLLTSSWLDMMGDRVQFWYKPDVSQDIFVDPPIPYVDPASARGNATSARPMTTQADRTADQSAAAAGGIVYRVQRGDAIWKIAKRFGVSNQSIIEANQLKNPSLLHAGQRLIIPGVNR